ncbi:hypothetical protein BBK82_22490 [Lentzea guizhouensis]|uniref:DUF8017 domain-containing protein n=1 Tax=Lentzea guizhouensis TaxID=1586287 RepID=A0A1B2HL16_9PSEU|nr:hypothetical protein [Lentzea guizhouensis]ANZ38417.1 hypothetical protein BBK82_22490 [Lentzea guizhouensis]
MTYPGGGGQGGWNDQPGWGQQQGDYPTGGYQGTGAYPQSGGHPQTGGFPQQQQQGYGGSGYGGLGVYGGFDQEPPKKSNKTLWLVLGAVVLVLFGGGGVATFMLMNKGDDQNAGPATSSSNPTTSTSQEPSGAATCKDEAWQCVETTLGYTYQVPKDWAQVDDRIPITGFQGVALTGVTSYGDYTCETKSYTKGTNGGALLEKGDINAVATEFTKAVATQYYSSGGAPQVALTQPKPVKIQHTQKDGKKVVVEGVQVDATITQTANKCLASKGMVKVVVLNGSAKLHALVVNGDLEGGGGGDKPPLPKEADLQKMIDSLQPNT